MRFCRLYILVFIFFLSFNTSILADESDKESADKEYNDERIALEKKKKSLVDQIELLEHQIELSIVKDPRINFFYLLGGVGYACYSKPSYYQNQCNNLTAGNYINGFAVSVFGGWQARKYLAMEGGMDYVQAHFRSMGVKYTLLFQPYIELNKSWSIMPKAGLGVSLVVMFSEVVMTDSPASGGFGFDLHGVLGVRANYKKLIFGVTYQHNFISGTDAFRILAEAGIKF